MMSGEKHPMLISGQRDTNWGTYRYQKLICLTWLGIKGSSLLIIIYLGWGKLVDIRHCWPADWWYHVSRENPLQWLQNQSFTAQAIPGHSPLQIWGLASDSLKNIKIKINKNKNRQNNNKSPVYFNPITGWKILHHLTCAQDQSLEIIRAADTAHEVIATWADPGGLTLTGTEGSGFILVTCSGNVYQHNPGEVSEVTCISDQCRRSHSPPALTLKQGYETLHNTVLSVCLLTVLRSRQPVPQYCVNSI